ncbi:MAG: CoA transferase, partial [Gemmatimonadetes bacterium]|nr:CoA transferase [Gemmatimonadota bacterium]
IYRLAAKSDVFVQNFRQGVAARLGMDYATLSKHNPRLIYASASGYGPEGPDSAQPAFDTVFDVYFSLRGADWGFEPEGDERQADLEALAESMAGAGGTSEACAPRVSAAHRRRVPDMSPLLA